MNNSPVPDPGPHPPTHLSTLVARLTWMFLSPVGLVLTFVLIVNFGQGWFTIADAMLLGIWAVMLAARWVELASGEGCDGFGNRMTVRDFPRFAVTVSSLLLMVWIVANLVGNVVAPALS